MPDTFDPYHVWLGIPPAEQPPNHYRLLALAMFEDAPEVIENAADRQMAHVRRAASGKHGDASQKLLNEISAAQRCLLNPELKHPYDAELGAKQRASGKQPALAASHAANGVAATTEWVATPKAKPPPAKSSKPPSPAPPRDASNATVRWKGAPAKASAAPIQVAAPSSVSQRTRSRKTAPWILLAVIVALAVLPVLALLVALASMSARDTAASVDEESPPSHIEPNGTAGDGDGPPALPAPGAGDGSDPTPRPQPQPIPVIPPTTVGGNNEPPDLDRDLVAYWKFDKPGVQRPAYDAAGVGEADRQSNRTPAPTDGHLGGAVSNPVMMWNHADWLSRRQSAFTFAIWFRPKSVSGSQSAAGKREASPPNREWQIVRSGDRIFARFFDDTPKNVELLIASPAGSLQINRWALLVARWDKDARVDGYHQSLWVGSASDAQLNRTNGKRPMNIPATNARFGIGDDDAGVPLNGDIDAAAYWDRALSEEEVRLYFNNGAGRTYPFD